MLVTVTDHTADTIHNLVNAKGVISMFTRELETAIRPDKLIAPTSGLPKKSQHQVSNTRKESDRVPTSSSGCTSKRAR